MMECSCGIVATGRCKECGEARCLTCGNFQPRPPGLDRDFGRCTGCVEQRNNAEASRRRLEAEEISAAGPLAVSCLAKSVATESVPVVNLWEGSVVESRSRWLRETTRRAEFKAVGRIVVLQPPARDHLKDEAGIGLSADSRFWSLEACSVVLPYVKIVYPPEPGYRGTPIRVYRSGEEKHWVSGEIGLWEFDLHQLAISVARDLNLI